ncbi:MAG TPA: DNA repair protein RecO [Candidatus Cloacimonadota bacterium]|nr:DNA repair protein RecO [Candidatus Cloacimonadota bacterium]HPT71961.1 DNA repair protein RecO [Candidatus Cloacimonadota bacterium]
MVDNQDKQIVTKGIILDKTDYSESSLILVVFSEDLGNISVIVKGAKREKRPDAGNYQIMNLLEFSLIKQQSDMYLLHSSSYLQALSKLNNWEIFKLQCAGLELYNAIIIPQEDAHDYFELLNHYLVYIQKVEKNGIMIFWRLLLRVFQKMGIELNVQTCNRCHSDKKPLTHYNSMSSGFLCENCTFELGEPSIPIDQKTAEILHLLPQIGNHIHEIEISESQIIEIQTIFNRHFEDHLHKKLYFKSLKL